MRAAQKVDYAQGGSLEESFISLDKGKETLVSSSMGDAERWLSFVPCQPQPGP
jgi:hypothetical protein